MEKMIAHPPAGGEKRRRSDSIGGVRKDPPKNARRPGSPFREILLLLLAAAFLAAPGRIQAWDTEEVEGEERKQRAFFGAGIAVGLESDSSEANLALNFGSIRRLGHGFGAGWEAALHDLYSSGDPVYGGAIVLFRLGVTAEWLPPFPRDTRPFLGGGAGWYSWGERGGCGDRVCWPWRDSARHDAFGGWVGGGVRMPRGWGRDLSIAAQFHPWSTWNEAWDFLNVFVTIGW
ncbi:MAG: hypothetical protein JW958_03750 [Candidatus Eisenbacteria bacterium]|nr:hypothetical protein [Candidatus Eisenbacteria bacterium]